MVAENAVRRFDNDVYQLKSPTNTLKLTRAFTLIELLVVIAIIAILASLSLPAIVTAVARGQMVQTVSNGKQIALAASALAFERANGDANVGWPGDLAEASGPGVEKVSNIAGYVDRLVQYDKLQKGDVAKVFAAPGIQPWSGQGKFDSKYSAFKVYKVKESDGGNTVLLATKNYTYNQDLSDPQAKPYGDKGFVVIRKGGDGASYHRKQAKLTLQIGTLPGKTDSSTPGSESRDDYWD